MVVTAAKARRRGGANMSAAQRQGGQRADAEVLGSASRGRGRRDTRRQREGGAARPAKTAAAKRTRGPRKMSAAARKRISDAQKKRWAERRRANG